MHHKKCGGRIFYDNVNSHGDDVEIYCIRCGKAWHLNASKNKLAEWILKRARRSQGIDYLITSSSTVNFARE